MPEEIMIQHCSPTLAKIKTGNIFTHPYGSKEEMRTELRRWNLLLGKKGLRVLPLSYKDGRALIYVYRPASLDRDLQHDTARRILCERGYSPDKSTKCVEHLIKKLGGADEFPHEIGLFLGYPPEDVKGFIENRDGFVCSGMWKVYSDEEGAKKLFAKYKKCTAVYRDCHKRGRSVERLTVSG